MAEKIYGRISEGKVVEFPVSETMIRNRQKGFAEYREAFYRPRITPSLYEGVRETVKLLDDKVYVSFETYQLGLNSLLVNINRKAEFKDANGKVVVSKLDAGLFDVICKMAIVAVQEHLDELAANKGYSSGIDQAASFVTSSVAEYVADGKRASEIRDQTWVVFESYKNKVLSGELDFPTSANNFTALIPPLSW